MGGSVCEELTSAWSLTLAISIRDVKCSLDSRPVVDGISLEVEPGDLVAVIGPSGCGKSTLLRCINGLETLSAGEIKVYDTKLEAPSKIGMAEFRHRAFAVRQIVGMVFQSFNLFPHLTVFQNIALGPEVVLGLSKDVAAVRTEQLLQKVGLIGKAHSYPDVLSGGQQQRAAIARALAMNPKLLLYDEPTSALDPTLVHEVLRVMKQLDEEGMTQIVVTHEMRFARDVADRVLFLEDGKIVEIGPPEQIFGSPQSERTRNYLRHFQ